MKYINPIKTPTTKKAYKSILEEADSIKSRRDKIQSSVISKYGFLKELDSVFVPLQQMSAINAKSERLFNKINHHLWLRLTDLTEQQVATNERVIIKLLIRQKELSRLKDKITQEHKPLLDYINNIRSEALREHENMITLHSQYLNLTSALNAAQEKFRVQDK
ncbi:hypothetical protein QX249_09940 [Vibrio parahaemolyticus]|uniref:Uncharacterized protein n=1 Tax=Vibrio parahaemolyticus TaxID=670 RepID=A0AAW8Q3D1_VIBPH|nr:hypothetical protein [Vibrio parahaemolyticus]EGR2229583.1 hypothetical protein [Vibrio parahaemolyticus]MDS1820978.1 hypothetical protein [Vibrio parahaemolyticus]